ncbi:hypothetical protein [Streptomyces sp. G45]|uniref:hypothetical protein n=1 Tax=Streptomyces sp. G45 TaxID=3406627 RepID=UPI003C256366
MITGVRDFDRTEFGDAQPDRTLWTAAITQDEREACREPYGALERSPAARWRARTCQARHLAAIRLERHRLAKPNEAIGRAS